MKSNFYKLILFSFISLFFFACNETAKEAPTDTDADQLQTEKSLKSGEKTPQADEPKAVAPKAATIDLDKVDLSSLKKLTTKKGDGEGDCDSETTKYQMGDQVLAVYDYDCYDYGSGIVYYLTNAREEVQKVHERRKSNYIDKDDSGNDAPFVEINENIYDFTQEPTGLMALNDNLINQFNVPQYNLVNLQGDPWLVMTEKEGTTLFGKKVSLNDYDQVKQMIIDSLVSMNGVPGEIPNKTVGTVGMGTRGEYRSMCEEAIEEAKKIMIAKNTDPFNRTQKKLTAKKAEGEHTTQAHWQKNYNSLWQ